MQMCHLALPVGRLIFFFFFFSSRLVPLGKLFVSGGLTKPKGNEKEYSFSSFNLISLKYPQMWNCVS